MFFSDVSPIVSVSLEDTGTDTVGSIISMNLVARGMFGLSAENAHLNASTLFIPPYNALFTRRIEELRDGAKARQPPRPVASCWILSAHASASDSNHVARRGAHRLRLRRGRHRRREGACRGADCCTNVMAPASA